MAAKEDYTFGEGMFTCRISKSEADMLNNELDILYPETTDPDKKIGAREIFFNLVDYAISRAPKFKKAVSLDSDLERIKELEKQVSDLQGIQEQNKLTIEKYFKQLEVFSEEKDLLQKSVDEKANKIQALTTENQLLANSSVLPENTLILPLSPLQMGTLNLVTEKTAAKKKMDLTPKDILFGLFWYYYIVREFEYRNYPHVLSNSEFKQLAAQYPEENV
jgi:hypothetical protein